MIHKWYSPSFPIQCVTFSVLHVSTWYHMLYYTNHTYNETNIFVFYVNDREMLEAYMLQVWCTFKQAFGWKGLLSETKIFGLCCAIEVQRLEKLSKWGSWCLYCCSIVQNKNDLTFKSPRCTILVQLRQSLISVFFIFLLLYLTFLNFLCGW